MKAQAWERLEILCVFLCLKLSFRGGRLSLSSRQLSTNASGCLLAFLLRWVSFVCSPTSTGRLLCVEWLERIEENEKD